MDKKFKIWVSDFDGTLSNTEFEISEKVKFAIKRLIEKGYIFVIATGRPYHGIIRNVCKDLHLSAPQITSGGSQIYNPQNDTLLWSQYISSQTVQKLIKSFSESGYLFSVENRDYVCTPNKTIMRGYGPGVIFKDLDSVDDTGVYKMVLEINEPHDSKKRIEQLNSLYPDLHIVRSGIFKVVLDITSEKATKHLAVLELSKMLEVDPGLMVGIGDGYNDYPLLSVCGFKIALENAPDHVKEIADLVVPDVKGDGFAIAVDKLL